MTDDIVERLREEGFITHMARLPRESKILHEAADEIERLRQLSGDSGRLRAERDEARRLYINEMCLREYGDLSARIVEARQRGWDCFKENTNV